MRQFKNNVGTIGLALLFAMTLLAVPSADAQINPGRLSGTLVDEEGNPVEGIVLVLTPEDGGKARKVKIKKKGRFDIPFLPAGKWKIATEDPAQFLKSMHYLHKGGDGLKLGEMERDGHPTTGLPAFHLSINGHGKLDLVLAAAGYREQLAGQISLHKASGSLKRALELYEEGDMQEVVKEADGILEKQPGLAEALYLRGASLWQLKRYDEAEDDMRAALAKKDDLSRMHGILGTSLVEHAIDVRKAGDDARAEALCAEAVGHLQTEIERSPDDPSLRMNLVIAMEGAGVDEGLEEAYKAVLATDPENETIAMRLAAFYAREGRKDEAAELIGERGIEGRDSANTLYNIAVGLYNDGKSEEAMEYIDRILAADPEHIEVISLSGYLHLSTGDPAAALEAFERFVELVPAERSEAERGLVEALKAQLNK